MSRRTRLRWLLLLPIGALVLALALVKLLYGRGVAYEDVNTVALVPTEAVEVAATLEFPPGNVTSAPDGRVFFNLHPFAHAHRFTDAFVFELEGGAPRPYPDLESQEDLKYVFGMTVDARGRLWLISPATLDRARTRLIAFDLATGARVVDHEFERGVARFAQDLRVSADGRTIYMADTGAFRFTSAALVVADTETWETRRVLEGHASTQPQRWSIETARGRHSVGWGLVTFSVGVDGIALSDDGRWLYYATMSHDGLYRVPAEALRDPTRTPEQLARAVERVGRKPLSDGIELDEDGAVLITDVEHGALVRVAPATGELQTLARVDGVVWADGVTVSPVDGGVYFTDSAIPSYLDPLLRPPSEDVLARGRPYRLYRVPPR